MQKPRPTGNYWIDLRNQDDWDEWCSEASLEEELENLIEEESTGGQANGFV